MTCKCTTQLCAACLDKLLEQHRKVKIEPADGLTKLKAAIKEIWPKKDDQEEVLAKIYDFYIDGRVDSKSGTWLLLGKHPKSVLVEGTEPTVWLFNNEIRIEHANHAKFLKDHDMPYVL
jgi:hypothetical protein